LYYYGKIYQPGVSGTNVKMGRRLMDRNQIIGLAFQSVAALLIQLKSSPDHWRFVPIGNTVYLSPQTVSEGHI
jgi:hypothetical protein